MRRALIALALTPLAVAVLWAASPVMPGQHTPTDANEQVATEAEAARVGGAVGPAPSEPWHLLRSSDHVARQSDRREQPPAVPAPWVAAPDEEQADAKELAATIVQDLTTYEAGTSLDDLARRVAGEPAGQEALRDAATDVFHADRWSRGEIVYAQLGGLRNGRSSIMVVVRQTTGRGSDILSSETRTLDVRLVRTDRGWAFDQLASAGGRPVPRPDTLSPEAIAVLDHPAIELPSSARWDIHRGTVSTTLLRVMADLADHTPYGVVVLETGHPLNVFETQRTSRHTVGQAVDVYRLDARRVSEDRADGSWTQQVVRWLYGHPDVANLGGPWALDGIGGRSFTDAVHHDHLHVAVRGA